MSKLSKLLFNLGWKIRFILTKERNCELFDNAKPVEFKPEIPNFVTDTKYCGIPSNIYYHR